MLPRCLTLSSILVMVVSPWSVEAGSQGQITVRQKTRGIVPRGIGCIESCDGLPNGDYQSCQSCGVFATCSNGQLYDGRLCIFRGGIVWDDFTKKCEWVSSTCPELDEDDSPRCVRDCSEIQDGDYQSCDSCAHYTSCVGGYTYANRPCPPSTLWDDDVKECSWGSNTCDYKRLRSTKQKATQGFLKTPYWGPFVP